MSDFNTNFWALFVAVATGVSIFACVLMLWTTLRKRVVSAADNTTGHVWDGDLREMNNPLPRWWVWLFVITIVFAAVYLAAYPGMGTYEGRLNWTSVGQHDKDVAKAREELAPLYSRFAAMKIEDIAADPQAMGIGERLFLNNCAQCHGSDARGSKSFPNLADRDWLHGGTPDKILETITLGRIGNMPPMAAAVGGPDDVRNVAHYVLSLSGSPHDSVRANLGKSKFTACAACHGNGGVGNQLLGAPNLSDGIWLHGWGEQAIIDMVNKGRTNVMPPQAEKFAPEQLRVLAAYVWGLSNGPQAGSKAKP